MVWFLVRAVAGEEKGIRGDFRGSGVGKNGNVYPPVLPPPGVTFPRSPFRVRNRELNVPPETPNPGKTPPRKVYPRGGGLPFTPGKKKNPGVPRGNPPR